MYIEHIAVASKSITDSDKFFSDLLGLKRVREFVVPANLMSQFFGINRDHKIIRYTNDRMEIEVFITEDTSTVKDSYTHICLIVEDKIKLAEKAKDLGYKIIKVARKDKDDIYLFLRDNFGNLYEIKAA